MARLTGVRESLRSVMEDLSQQPTMVDVTIYYEGDIATPNFDEQKQSNTWVQALVMPTEKGEEYMGARFNKKLN